MRCSRLWFCAALSILAAAFLFNRLASGSIAGPAGLEVVAGSAWVFIQQPAAARSITPPGRSGAAPRGAYPNSTLPVVAGHPDCSVLNDGSGPVCSTLPGVATCSTQCNDDAGDFSCSAFGSGSPGLGHCSTVRRGTGCSVLQPSLGAPGSAICSAAFPFTVESSFCSTLSTQRRQACSVENPGPMGNACSSFDVGGEAYCSVLGQGGSERSFCTTFRDGQKECSAITSIATGAGGCSIHVGATGVCTALKLAPSGSCSVMSSGHCSVLPGPGPGPTGRCVQ